MGKKCENFAGLANKRIIIEQRVDTPDTHGGTSVVWSTLHTVWAIIEPWTGREYFADGKKEPRVDTRITIRYQDDLKDIRDASKYRVNFNSRYYPISYLKNLDEELMSNFNSRYQREGKAYQMLFCTENAPEN